MNTAEKLDTKRIPVIVTTAHRGVFFGYTDNYEGEVIDLYQARMCIYWSADMKGLPGLADMGPSKTCRISPPAPKIRLKDITAVLGLTDKAVENWEKAPWSE